MTFTNITKALSDIKRIEILLKLKKDKICFGEVAKNVNLNPRALSYHLVRLKVADLIYESIYKNYIYYALNLSILDELYLW